MITLAIDLGTSGAKAALISPEGTSSCTTAYPTHVGTGGVVEQDPRDWLRAVATSVAGLGSADYDAVALTGQMQDLVRYSGGHLAGDAWLYSDTRSQPEAEQIHRDFPDWDQLTGNEQGATSNAAMLMRAGVSRDDEFLFSPSGVVLKELGLGNHVDPTTASTTGLAGNGDWLDPVLERVGVRRSQLPTISQGLIGQVGANELDLKEGVPVYLAPGDAGATTAGIVGTSPGADYLYLGTTGWHARVLERPQNTPGTVHRLTFGSHSLQIAALLAAASASDWARNLYLGGTSPEAADAQLTSRGYSGLTAIPSINGERFPVRSDTLGAGIVDKRATTTPIECYQAILESVVLSLSLACDPADRGDIAVVGGGSRSTPWMRMVADILGRPAVLFDDSDAALHGAALYADSELRPLSHTPTRRIAPDPRAHDSYAGAAHKQLRLMEFLAE
ncbi:FGGY-family carbohydrate kinase [Corynebacterium lubricantis]|uniref:FGGY-family carbohydrate kinase n=1 Tax=Corynebacterium lubricantis TaxID=541095 RepID=UPI0003804103|nr:FGGY-family carbohydrate kinase [Corynebacterium lubricantis]